MRLKPVSGNFGGARSLKAAFCSAFGISLLFHAAAFGSAWHALRNRSSAAVHAPPRDVWVGTTVSVDTDLVGVSVPAKPESQDTQEPIASRGPKAELTAPLTAKIVKPKPRAAPLGDETTGKPQALAASEVAQPKVVKENTLVQASKPRSAASVDLKRAMLDSSSQKEASAGAFGAVGVDLFRERRLPRALTRAMPQAISGESKWWAHPVGTLGRVHFEVLLDDEGKIQELRITEESSHAMLARVLRRAGRILSINRFAFSEGTTPNAWQRFELRLDCEQVTPASDDTGEAGDTFSMGYEAPTAQEPGRAHIQDARGKRMRATVRVLPAVRQSGGAPAAESSNDSE